MRKSIFIVMLFLTPGIALAQSTKSDSNSMVLKTWSWNHNYTTIQNENIDTGLFRHQIVNPVYNKSFSNTYNGNLGLAAQSNMVQQRSNLDFIFLNGFTPYLHTTGNTNYYSTLRPYTILNYSTGGSKRDLEQTLGVVHTQNVNPDFNVGLRYNLYSSEGQYLNQKARNNAFGFFSNYRKNRYSVYLSANINKLQHDNNGGIVHQDLLKGIDGNTKIVEVNLMDPAGGESFASTEIRNKSLMILNKYTLGNYTRGIDSAAIDTMEAKRPYYSFSHLFEIENNSKNYHDKQPLSGFYANVMDSAQTNDSVYSRRIFNSLRLELNEFKNLPGFMVSLDNEINRYLFRDYYYQHEVDSILVINDDPFSTGNYSPVPFVPLSFDFDTNGYEVLKKPVLFKDMVNTSISGSIYKTNWRKWNWFGMARYYISGYKASDYHLNAYIQRKFMDKYTVRIGMDFRNEQPSYFYEKFRSDHFNWETNLAKKMTNQLYARFNDKEGYLLLDLNAFHFSNYVFLAHGQGPDSTIMPVQTSNDFYLGSAILGLKFSMWKIFFNNKVSFQWLTSNEALDLPLFSVYNSTYYDQVVNFPWTGGRLRFQLGFDFYYNTKFYADAYMPALGLFYQQRESKTGNYPFVDAFFNLNIKRVNFFVKASHLNAGFSGANYFSTYLYPVSYRMIKLGITWYFNN